MDILAQVKDAVSKGLSLLGAAKKFGIPYAVVYRHMKNPKVRKHGGQTALSEEEEKLLVDRLVLCAKWGYPLDSFDLRVIVKGYLDRRGKQIKRFKNNMPRKDFAASFLARHKDELSERMCQNIKRSRAAVSRTKLILRMIQGGRIPSTVTKFGRSFNNVTPDLAEDIKEDDWLLVGFYTETAGASSSKPRYFIGRVLKIQATAVRTFEGTFMRAKSTRDNNVFFCVFPQVEDVCTFQYEQVVGKLLPPERFRRGQLKFEINNNSIS